MHHRRRPKIGRLADLDAEKIWWRHADDRKRMAIHRDAHADNRRIARKAPLPIVVTYDGDRMGARDLVVILGESSAEQRAHSERRKEAAGDPLPLRDFRLSIHHNVDAQARRESADPGNRLAPRAQLLEKSIREVAPYFVDFRNASHFEEE